MASQQDTTTSQDAEGVRSTLHVAGHPVHPTLIPFPIAFLTAAAATDVGFLVTGDDFWSRASVWLLAAGFITGLVAAAAGAVDFFTIERARSHRSGWIHFLGNAVVLAAALVNWILRMGDSEAVISPWGLIISVATAILLGVTGWTGGELSYRHQIGVTGH